jgi:ferredoxin
MEISVDSTVCQGYGQCNVIDPDLFPLDDDGYSAVGERRPVPPGEEHLAELGVDACPVTALRLNKG